MFIMTKDNYQAEEIGNKALALAKLTYKVDNIPKWFVLTKSAYHAYHNTKNFINSENSINNINTIKDTKKDTKKSTIETKQNSDVNKVDVNKNANNEMQKQAVLFALESALKDFEDNTLFAVRSSAVEEDGVSHSFAGQFETFLNIPKKNIFTYCEKVWESAFSDRVTLYKKTKNIEASVPAGLIQEMINAKCAGVAFAANPITGNIKETLVCAVEGLGDKLVDGTVNSADYVVENNTILSSPKNTIMEQEHVLEIARLSKICSEFFTQFQDIEWALYENKIYLLQSRPITTLKKISHLDATINLWDNSNIAESYNGVTTPLTFSFIRLAYEHVYREMCRMFSLSEKTIAEHERIFPHMLGLIKGQVYYNMISWYKLISILPGYKTNHEFMESMMGVKEPLPPHIKKLLPQNNTSKLGDLINITRGLFGLIYQFLKNEKNTQNFYKLLNHSLAEVDLKTLNLYELLDYYRSLEAKLLKKWNAPVSNDFLAMLFYGILKKISTSWCHIEDENKFNGLLRNTGDIISAKPAQLVREMATLIKDDNELIQLLLTQSPEKITHTLNFYLKYHLNSSHHSPNLQDKLASQIQEYLRLFGDRCINELKLESKTLNDEPLNLYRAVGTFALRLQNTNKTQDLEQNLDSTSHNNNLDEENLLKNLPFMRRHVFKFVLKHARLTIRNRENMRFERTRLFGVVRSIFRQIGVILASFGKISHADDIFYLELSEILCYIDGSATTYNLQGLIDVRKKEFASYDGTSPDRFETFDCVDLSTVHIKNTKMTTTISTTSITNENTIYGLACSPGIVRARARVVTNPNDAKLQAGEILVAQRTDPGWIMLFPLASAVVVEYGSLLSHAAIVVREMSIPAVVSVPNLFEWIKDGDIIEINGETGSIIKIKEVD